MICGIGIDIQQTEQMEKTMSDRFMTRVFTEKERLQYRLRGNALQSITGAFAAKEAVSKALGTGFSGMQWRDIEILHEKSGKPYACLHGNAKAKLQVIGANCVHISISHSKEYVVAQAILEVK